MYASLFSIVCALSLYGFDPQEYPLGIIATPSPSNRTNSSFSFQDDERTMSEESVVIVPGDLASTITIAIPRDEHEEDQARLLRDIKRKQQHVSILYAVTMGLAGVAGYSAWTTTSSEWWSGAAGSYATNCCLTGLGAILSTHDLIAMNREYQTNVRRRRED